MFGVWVKTLMRERLANRPFHICMNTHAEIVIGHLRLSVANLDRSLAFYCGLIGLVRGPQMGNITVLCPRTHHAITLDPPHKGAEQYILHGHTGMYHFSFFFSRHAELARVVKRFIDTAYDVEGVFDYGATLAIYLHDPDGIPVELYMERPLGKRQPVTHKELPTKSIDLESFLRELI